ncbi:hypothetical protein CDAR_476161 [Caerostris darwini]|uniref:Uncharacterized protein n=1 Tax=Caerostris darwini TaxID=1538125 RepID=A0AAV4W6T5_9ARAC|nr:hypothetical protein CDAR_476161 [Caerostris darwini]
MTACGRSLPGEMPIDDKPCSGLSSTSRTDENVDKVCAIVLKTDETIEAITELSEITWSSMQRILSGDLWMTRVVMKFNLHFD